MKTTLDKAKNVYGLVKKLYGPYERPDRRSHIVLVFDDLSKKTVSYPKFLMEIKLGKKLKEDETVHHKDEGIYNNKYSNLEVLPRKLHCYRDSLKARTPMVACIWCHESFELTASQRNSRALGNAGPFCSKPCVGNYTAYLQKGGKPKGRTTVEITYKKGI